MSLHAKAREHGANPQRGKMNHQVKLHSTVMRIESWAGMLFQHVRVEVLMLMGCRQRFQCPYPRKAVSRSTNLNGFLINLHFFCKVLQLLGQQ